MTVSGILTTSKSVVINVVGNPSLSNIDLGSSFGSYRQKLIWNFVDATTINFSNIGFHGLILAPYATLTARGAIDGQVIVSSYPASGEIHWKPFTSCIPL